MSTSARDTWTRQYQLSPIMLVGGLVPGATTPIISLTEGNAFNTGLLGPGQDIDLNSFFANFEPVPGSTLIENEVSTYPFANQTVAANAIITQGLHISLLMRCPARAPGGFQRKAAKLSALQSSLQQHIQAGGVFNVATPATIYTNCLLIVMRDVTQDVKNAMSAYQWDFYQPLLTLADAKTQYSASMSKLAAGVPSTGAPSGGAANVGSTAGAVAPTVVPAASGLPAAASGSPANPGSVGRP